MLTYSEWMKETKRGLLTPRSAKLKAVDSAFAKLNSSKNPQAELEATNQLIDALADWLDSKEGKWEESTRNAKGTVKKLVTQLSATPYGKGKLGKYVPQLVVTANTMPERIIVFSGHGSWESRKDGFINLPPKCYMEFYTMNMRTLSDSLGGDIDRGIVNGLVPDQVNGPYNSIPNNRLYPPHGLNIRKPDTRNWIVVNLPDPVPNTTKNIQIRIKDRFGGGADLETMFGLLQPVISNSSKVTFLWAACRAIGLKQTGIKIEGVNTMQR